MYKTQLSDNINESNIGWLQNSLSHVYTVFLHKNVSIEVSISFCKVWIL